MLQLLSTPHDALLEAIPVAVAILDRDYVIRFANPMFGEMTNMDHRAVVGRSILNAYPEDPQTQERFAAAYEVAFSGEPCVVDKARYRIAASSSSDAPIEERWWTVRCAPLPPSDGAIQRIVIVVEDRTAEVRADEMSDAVAAELQHRIANLLTMIATIARRTAKNSADLDTFLPAFEARIQALAGTHALLTGGNWDGMTFERLVRASLAAHLQGSSERIVLRGPEMRLKAAQAQAVAMALHELSTNAAKHGALAGNGGSLRIDWSGHQGGGFSFGWVEDGLDGIAAPEKKGFGSMILSRIVPSQLGGEASAEFAPTGLRYRLDVPGAA